MIKKIGIDNAGNKTEFTLYDERAGEYAEFDQLYQTNKNDFVKLKTAFAPHKPGSTGKVYVEYKANAKHVNGLYPSVIGLQWVIDA
jgi:hypothetical protein